MTIFTCLYAFVFIIYTHSMSHFIHLLLLLFFVINFVLFSSGAEDLHENKEFANVL